MPFILQMDSRCNIAEMSTGATLCLMGKKVPVLALVQKSRIKDRKKSLWTCCRCGARLKFQRDSGRS